MTWLTDEKRLALFPGFEPVQNPSSDLVEWSCALEITATPQRHSCIYVIHQLSDCSLVDASYIVSCLNFVTKYLHLIDDSENYSEIWL